MILGCHVLFLFIQAKQNRILKSAICLSMKIPILVQLAKIHYFSAILKQFSAIHSTCAQINDAVVFIIDSQDCVCHNMCEVILNWQVQRSFVDRDDHVLNLRVILDHSQDLLVMSLSVIPKSTLDKGEPYKLRIRLCLCFVDG